MKKLVILFAVLGVSCLHTIEPSPTGLVKKSSLELISEKIAGKSLLSLDELDDLFADLLLTEKEIAAKEASMATRGKDGRPAQKKRRVAATPQEDEALEVSEVALQRRRGVKRKIQDDKVQVQELIDPDPKGARDSMAQRYDDGEPFEKKRRVMSKKALQEEQEGVFVVKEPARKKYRQSFE